MEISKTFALTAVSGLVVGLGACGGSKIDPTAAVPDATGTPAVPDALGTATKECCAGKNECAKKGGCKVEGKNDCAGKNECAKKGGCKHRPDMPECAAK